MAINSDKDLLNSEVINTILTEADKSEERQRRTDTFNAYQIYSGNVETFVYDDLKVQRPKSYKGYTVSDISLSSMVTNKRSQAYAEEPIRSVSSNDTKTADLSDIYEEGGAEEQLEFYDILYNLNRYGTMWVNYNLEKQKYQFISMHAYEAILVRDKNDGEVQIVAMNYPNNTITSAARGGTNADATSDLIAENQVDSNADGETWVFWSADQHVQVNVSKQQVKTLDGFELKRNIDYVDIPDNPKNVNPLGVLPFVFKSMDTSVDYPVTNPLTEQTIKFNLQQSETLSAKNLHGSGVNVLKYPEKLQGKMDQMQHGLMSLVELPQSGDPDDAATDFNMLTSGSQLNPMSDIDMSYLEQIARQHGLENFKMEQGGASVESGISKAIQGASVQKIIEKNQKKFVKLEKDMFKIIKAWEAFLGKPRFKEDDELNIVFQKPKVLVSDRETLENLDKMLNLGLIEEWEKFIKMDPNLSEEDAKAKLERIEARNIEKANQFMGGFNADNEERVDKDSEA